MTIILVLGVLVGMVSAALGIGGGILMVPAFREFIPGMDQQTAVGTSLFTIIFVATLNAWRLNKGHADKMWRLAIVTGVGAVALSYLAGRWATNLDDQTLAAIFAIMALLLALRTFLLQNPAPGTTQRSSAKPKTLGIGLGIGGLMGAASGLTGIGGGGVFVPLALWSRLVSNERVVALSNIVMVMTCIAGSAAYMMSDTPTTLDHTIGHVHWPTALMVFVGAQAGSPIGKKINAHLSLKRRRVIMGTLLLVIAARFLGRAGLF